MKKLFIFLLISFAQFTDAQIDSLGNYAYSNGVNDVWGYVDEDDNEYAIVGLVNGISVVDVTQPQMPLEVYRDNASETPWRDIKVYGDYAYVTDESSESNGLTIYDLSALPNGDVVKLKEFSGDQNPFKTAHNIWIDEKGRAFVVGTDRSQGMIVFDLTVDPENPTEIGSYDDYYFHDIYVRNDTAYASLINVGDLMLLDLSEINNPTVISRIKTRERFTHNAWPSKNGKYVYTTDEVPGAEIGVFDISDASDPEKVGGYQFNIKCKEMPHNVYVDDSVVWLAYYRTGIIALNGFLPDILVEVDVFDTAPLDSGSGGNGVWGVYPYLPSGTILASDMQNGLFTFNYNHKRAKYLRGKVADEATNFPLANVEYKLLGSNQIKNTPLNGSFGIGSTGQDILQVVFSKPGYYPDTAAVEINLNQVIDTVIELEKIPTPVINFSLSSNQGNPIDNGTALITGVNWTAEYETDALGRFAIDDLPLGDYEIYLGAFGFMNDCYDLQIIGSGAVRNFTLTEGIYDDFSANQGWETFAIEEEVRWERTTPIASFKSETGIQADPGEDAGGSACGSFAFCTDIEPGVSANNSTVNFDNYLVSPKFNITGFSDVVVSIDYWLATENNGNDTLRFGFITGNDTVYVDQRTSANIMRQWVNYSTDLYSHNFQTDSVQFIVKITDDLKPWNVIDAAIDNFEVIYLTSANTSGANKCITVFPNSVQFNCGKAAYQVLDINGKLLASGYSNHASLNTLQTGLYILNVQGKGTVKIIKHD